MAIATTNNIGMSLSAASVAQAVRLLNKQYEVRMPQYRVDIDTCDDPDVTLFSYKGLIWDDVCSGPIFSQNHQGINQQVKKISGFDVIEHKRKIHDLYWYRKYKSQTT